MAERPMARSRGPGFRQHLGVFDRDLVDQVVHRRTAEAFDDVLLIAMEPPGEVIPGPFIYRDYVDDQRISLPMADPFAVERGIWVFAMRTPIGGHHAKVVI